MGTSDKIAFRIIGERGARNERIDKLTFQYFAFDCTLNFDVFEHVPGDATALREIYRRSEVNGTLLL